MLSGLAYKEQYVQVLLFLSMLKFESDGIVMQKRSRDTKERIFKAAVAEFAKSGFHGARVDNIAKKAKSNKERIYAYFGSKEDLFIEVWKRTYMLIIEVDEQFMDLTDEDIPSLTGIILKRYVHFHQEHSEFWKIFVWENMLDGKHTEKVKGFKERPYKHLRRLYARGQELGFFSREVSFETYMFVITAVSFFYASNRCTMSQSLSINLTNNDVVEGMIEEATKMLNGK